MCERVSARACAACGARARTHAHECAGRTVSARTLACESLSERLRRMRRAGANARTWVNNHAFAALPRVVVNAAHGCAAGSSNHGRFVLRQGILRRESRCVFRKAGPDCVCMDACLRVSIRALAPHAARGRERTVANLYSLWWERLQPRGSQIRNTSKKASGLKPLPPNQVQQLGEQIWICPT